MIQPGDNAPPGFEYCNAWSAFIRVWHWLLAVSVISGWLLGEFRTFSVMQWHMYCGYTTGVLLLLRIGYGLFGPASARFSSLAFTPGQFLRYTKTLIRREPGGLPGHNPLGALSVIILLALLCVQVATGLFAEDDSLFYSGPLASEVSSSTVLTLTATHDFVSNLVLMFVMLHIGAAVFYLVWKRENLIGAMFTGKKLVRRSTDSDDDIKAE